MLSKINLFGFLSPVGLPFAFLKLLSGGNIFVVAAAYGVSKIYTFFSLSGLLIAIYEIVFLTLFFFAKEMLKTKKKWLLSLVFVCLSNVLYLYYSLSTLTTLWHFMVSVFLQILIVLFFAKFFTAFKGKYVLFKFSHSDYLVFSIMALFISIGIFSFEFQKYLGLFFALFPVVLFCKVMPAEKYFASCTTLAVGSLLASGNVLYLILISVAALILLEVKSFGKFVYAAVALCVFSVFALIFKLFDVFSLVSMFFAVFGFVIIPSKLTNRFSCLFDVEAKSFILSELEGQKIDGIRAKLSLMAETFRDMQKEFKFLVVGKISREKASIELAADVIAKCCSGCENFKSCFYGTINKRALFESLVSKAIENEKIDPTDLTNGLEAYCSKHGIVVSEINQTAKMFHSYERAVKTEDVSKLLIASELENFSDIFANFSKNLGSCSKVNERLSAVLKDKFMNGLIDAKEVVILENEYGIESISIVLPSEQVTKKEVAEIISKVTKNFVKIKEARHLEFSGLSLAKFIPLPKISANFAVSSKAKENKNGDSMVISKLADNKYFVAICDGMGHGEGANKISGMVLSLIKSMFTVGLDDNLILQSVNKLLLPAGLDNFTTLDACVIDLDAGQAVFIKLGSSVSVIKHASTSEIIASESLPIGIVQNLKPTIIKKQISAGDMLFLASDGVVDSFSTPNQFKSFINDSKIYNMQKYLDDIVEDATSLNQKHIDDMTIIGINLLKN